MSLTFSFFQRDMSSVIAGIRNSVTSSVQNFSGWKSDRKIVVFESDDWGGIRMPNIEVFDKAIKHGIEISKCPFNTFDTIANAFDFESLFEILTRFADKNGNHPVITANTIVANPDFDRIRRNNFQSYYFETFTDTLEKYYPNTNVFSYWKVGIQNNIFKPQLHGREHLYVKRWMSFLQKESKETLFAFNNNFFGLSKSITKEIRGSFLPAFDLIDYSEIESQKQILKEAQLIFQTKFGYRSRSFIAPNYTWNRALDPFLKTIGIDVLQGSTYQQEPTPNIGIKRIRHYTGEFNSSGQVYLSRNVLFEPSLYPKVNWFKTVINQIGNSFYWNTPAIVSVHRLNFIGGLNEANRSRNLLLFSQILIEILRKWPDVEFLSSDQLGTLILNK